MGYTFTNKKIRIWVTIGLVCFSLTALAKKNEPALTADLGFVTIGSLPTGSNQINPIRMQALQETSFQLGAQGALAWRALQINATLSKEARYLDRVFDFNQLLINHNVLPPVLVEANDALDLDSSTQAIRTASKIYRIIAPAQFTTAPPHWRTYLWMEYKKPTLPDHTLLPATQPEADVWNASLKEGWKQGIQQANSIFGVNLSRLKRDYLGMVLYNKLLQQRMVSAPFIAQANMGVTGDSQEIRINDNVARITDQSKLQPDSSKWNPVITN